ncbi:four helix bundle protein [Haloimpatiens massiliensis]|uniref:four helix bundle protein n=1 Tax=Haloimpatiens massiliensis TaxID=1658110 RepID=UPI001FA91383|nr:four helix bundle protein [Haloimpatiens massiliensis]
MISEQNSIIYKKCFKFSLEIITLCKYLNNSKKEFVLSNQILRCSTSIGANVSESFNAQSHKEYISKLYISLKEASETKYWLELLNASNTINDATYKDLLDQITQIIKILSSIIRNTKLKHHL